MTSKDPQEAFTGLPHRFRQGEGLSFSEFGLKAPDLYPADHSTRYINIKAAYLSFFAESQQPSFENMTLKGQHCEPDVSSQGGRFLADW